MMVVCLTASATEWKLYLLLGGVSTIVSKIQKLGRGTRIFNLYSFRCCNPIK